MSDRRKKSYRTRLLDDLRICKALIETNPQDPYITDMIEIVDIIEEKLETLKQYHRDYYDKTKKSRGKN